MVREKLILKCVGEHQSLTTHGRKITLNSILILHDCVREKLTFEVLLRQGVANLLNSLVLAAKYPCRVLSRKNGELRRQGSIAYLVVDWICQSFVTVRSVKHRED